MKKRALALVMSAVLLIIASCACFVSTGCADSGEAISVEAVSMITGVGNTGVVDRYSGIVVSSNTVKLEKSAELTVDQIYVEVGDEVKTGDMLFSYDTEMVELTLNKLTLEIEQLTSLLANMEAQIKNLEARANRTTGTAKLEITIELQSTQIDYRENEYSLETKQNQINELKAMVSGSDVLSAVDGKVQNINENGMDSNGNAAPFMTIVEAGAFRVEGEVNELNLRNLVVGMPALVRSRIDDSTWNGNIDSISSNPIEEANNGYYTYDSTSSGTTSSSYAFYVKLDSTDGLILGQHVYIEPDYGQSSGGTGIMLPSYYICEPDGNAYVWAANNFDKLKKQSVTLGEYNPESDCYEIMDGLSAEDYIAFPDESCRDGAPVVKYDESSFGGDDVVDPDVTDNNEYVDEGAVIEKAEG